MLYFWRQYHLISKFSKSCCWKLLIGTFSFSCQFATNCIFYSQLCGPLGSGTQFIIIKSCKQVFFYNLGAVHKLRHPGRWREGVGQMLTLDDMRGRGDQGKTDRLTHGGCGGNVKSESKLAITLTLNVLLGMPKVPQRVPEVTSWVPKGW